MSEAIRKNLYRYHEAQLQLDAAGGPEHDAVLFELLIELQETILASFGLPAAQKHIKKLWKFANRKITEDSIEKTIALLHRAAEKHLLSPVSTPLELLAKAEKSQSSAYNVLPELGYITHDYFIFIYHELLLTGKASPKEILDEIETVRRLDCYAQLYHLKHTPTPGFDVDLIFDRLNKELRFLEFYLRPPETPSWVLEDDEDEKPFGPGGIQGEILSVPDVAYELVKEPFEVQEIIFSWDSGVTLFGRFRMQNGYRTIMLGCEQESLGALLEQYPLGQAILPEIQLTSERPEIDEPTIINLKDQFGTTLTFSDHYLEIGQAEDPDDSTPGNFYFLSEAIPKEQHEAKEKAEEQLRELCQRYITYAELQEHGLTKAEARIAAGLEEEEIFKTARLLYQFVQTGGNITF